MIPRRTVLLALLCASIAPQLYAQEQADSLFTRRDVLIPMRDGTQLYTQIFTPLRSTNHVPILFFRTPYGTAHLNAARMTAW